MKHTFKNLMVIGFLFTHFLAAGDTSMQKEYLKKVFADYEVCSEIKSASTVIAVTKNNYEQEILQSKKSVIILVSATWCTPCQLVKPIYAVVADENQEAFRFVSIDYDSFHEFVEEQKIEGVPTMLVCHHGKIVGQSPAFMTKDDFAKTLDSIKEFLANR